MSQEGHSDHLHERSLVSLCSDELFNFVYLLGYTYLTDIRVTDCTHDMIGPKCDDILPLNARERKSRRLVTSCKVLAYSPQITHECQSREKPFLLAPNIICAVQGLYFQPAMRLMTEAQPLHYAAHAVNCIQISEWKDSIPS